jgi:putative RNA 2'-phosphotransferase
VWLRFPRHRDTRYVLNPALHALRIIACLFKLISNLAMNKRYAEVSKFLSFVLRHQPDAIGITLDLEGWTDIAALIAAADKDGKHLDDDLIRAVVTTSDKKRFAISTDGLRIRAVQGHSTDSVDINYVERIPPEILYHGTATRFIESIRENGLLPGSRQYVHLSQDEETALTVGKRHGKPVILKIRALHMHERGFKFFQAENGVWLVSEAPMMFIVY